MSKKYLESGVNLEKGYEVVSRIKKHVSSTFNLGTMQNIGGFGGMFDLSKYNVKEPVLVSGTDGVGTKLLLAQDANNHSSIGIDLVAMCVNDIVTVGAKPLFFLDYIAIGENNPDTIEEIIKGITEGCKQAGASLIGGETAEMPDVYNGNHYDLAGFTTGVVEKSKIIDLNNVTEGNILIGLPSSGLHSNGFSLVRKVFFKDNNFSLDYNFKELEISLIEELLKPTKIYVEGILELMNKVNVSSLSHITGGGFIENVPRAIPSNLGVTIYKDSFTTHPIFYLIQKLGEIEETEMYNIFNMGIGMILVIKEEDKDKTLDILNEFKLSPKVIGEVTTNKGVKII
ncbi:MAG: Phosphoribosylformylglycinamidine cyclo-ligase [Candidatus Izimaplasma bacterium HR2]|nr:MAG: Phosphoribosylformylglycinamidine cyclo-ligase [Candidatus Izimaplasma bacterium HR2]